ncbi:hypothetical protein V495_00638 [Pseudogymnoascus sp. VKM F-4514 (FW-929)]|nr:hypothetical protein V495_00638 [Pseudogymnoascus sp. VKM F-4514 (FW-929)]KFY65945.1 hypothetical protein V497_01202 [Pseudogymnoascus sp. VKM F-4516 (FW-969)]
MLVPVHVVQYYTVQYYVQPLPGKTKIKRHLRVLKVERSPKYLYLGNRKSLTDQCRVIGQDIRAPAQKKLQISVPIAPSKLPDPQFSNFLPTSQQNACARNLLL